MARKNLEWCDLGIKLLGSCSDDSNAINFYAIDEEDPKVIHLYLRSPIFDEETLRLMGRK